MFTDHRPARGGSRHARDYDRDGGDFRLKVDIPYFSGNLNIEDFIDWLADIDKFFDYIRVPKENRVTLVACRLKGGVSAWWERLQTKRIREGKQPVKTWYKMRQLLKRDFLPLDYEQILFQQYQICHQGVRSIHKCVAKFMRLAEQKYLRESEGQQPARYLEGLKPQIRDKIGVQVMRNLHEAKNIALKVEFMMQDQGGYESVRKNFNRENSRAPVENKVTIS